MGKKHFHLIRSRFLIGACHKQMCQKQNHKIRKCDTADRATKAQPQSRHCEILDVHNISSCYNVPEILWQKSKARISLVSTYLLLNLSSYGNSAAEIHSENFHNRRMPLRSRSYRKWQWNSFRIESGDWIVELLEDGGAAA